MTVLHTETYAGRRLEVVQEWSGAGLRWRLDGRLSCGAFYTDSGGEVIHGATLEDVIATAARAGRRWVDLGEGAGRSTLSAIEDARTF